MHTGFLLSLVIIFGVSALAVFLLNKIKVPSVVGFLISGIFIGPHGIGLIEKVDEIELFAESGVILLLFTLGIEFSLSKLLKMKKVVFGSGSIQLFSTVLITMLISNYFLQNWAESLFIGFLVSLSSTAIVLKIMSSKSEIQTPHGRSMIGILLFQDLVVVLFMVLIPVLAGKQSSSSDIFFIIIKALIIITLIVTLARWVIPKLLNQIVKTRNRELFLISIILLCFGTALFTNYYGLSLSLGAFLAGMIISESEYAHQATAEIIPFKESFMGLFFVSVGMLLNLSFLAEHFIIVSILVLSIFILKSLLGFIAALSVNLPFRTSLITGLGLAQIGEFSFVLAIAGKAAGLIPDFEYQLFLSSSVITMLAAPFIIMRAPYITAGIVSRAGNRLAKISKFHHKNSDLNTTISNHVIIIGFGFNGQNLARILKETGIPYKILEMNSETVKRKKKDGEPIYFGDASGQEHLIRLGVKTARLLVCTVADPIAQRQIISTARHLSPCVNIIVRTRYLSSVDELKALGANEVIPEEFETAVEVFSRVLGYFRFPHSIIENLSLQVRKDNYALMRGKNESQKPLITKFDCLPEIEFDGYHIESDSLIIGKTIENINVRQTTGVTIIAIRRHDNVFLNPEPSFVFQENDTVLYTGTQEQMDNAALFFKELVTLNKK